VDCVLWGCSRSLPARRHGSVAGGPPGPTGRGSWAGPGPPPAPVAASASTPASHSVTVPSRHAGFTHLNLHPCPSNFGSIQLFDTVLGIPRILHLDESKAGGSARYPYIHYLSNFLECFLEVPAICLVLQSAHVHLALRIPCVMSHDQFLKGCSKRV